ncbi:MAG: hypothetical protein LBM38_03280 [Clostridiales bacterium]|jgi:hypothetical protein|nr:hypothetical protein [Clostridiales bacterium]
MKKTITQDEAKNFGITTNHELMDNGEKRFRLLASDGTSYIRIEAPDIGCWQNSHYHTSLQEMCIVQSGWVVFAEESGDEIRFRKFNKCEYFLTQPNVPHNVYMSANAITLTVKFGHIEESDWIAYHKLDEKTKPISESDLEDLVAC